MTSCLKINILYNFVEATEEKTGLKTWFLINVVKYNVTMLLHPSEK